MPIAPPPPTVNIPDFAGPLDLLLHLIRDNKLDIAAISVTLITDQYLAIIADAHERKLQLAGEFFVIAATLLEIKTRMLLPAPPKAADDDDESVDPREDLARRLLEYERFKLAAAYLDESAQERARCFLRSVDGTLAEYDPPAAIFGQASPQSLLKALQSVLERAAAAEPHEVTSVHRKKLSLHLAIRLLSAKVQDAGEAGLDFAELWDEPLVLLEVVMTFLALLELIRQQKVDAAQLGPMAPIHVKARA
jgi:segregation and condensation protein A